MTGQSLVNQVKPFAGHNIVHLCPNKVLKASESVSILLVVPSRRLLPLSTSVLSSPIDALSSISFSIFIGKRGFFSAGLIAAFSSGERDFIQKIASSNTFWICLGRVSSHRLRTCSTRTGVRTSNTAANRIKYSQSCGDNCAPAFTFWIGSLAGVSNSRSNHPSNSSVKP